MIITLKLLKFFYKLSNNSLPPYFDSYKTLIQPLTDRYPLRRPLYQTFRVNHEFARISLKYQFVSFLNNLSETNSQFLNTIFEHVHRVCYLARARAMARVVLTQIEFARAICGSRKILPMLQ